MMTRDQKLLAAAAYRRSGMSWVEIGRRLGESRRAIRRDLEAEGRADGWGDSTLRWSRVKLGRQPSKSLSK